MHLRWSITNPYLIFVGGPDMAPKPPNVRTAPGNPWRSSILVPSRGLDMAPNPPNVRTAPGNPWRSSILVPSRGPDMAPKPPNVRTAPGNPWRSSNARRSFEQYVPPDAHAGEHDHDEEYALERAVGQPPAGQRAELRAGHGAQGDHERGAQRDLAGDELADDAGSGRERRDSERAADGHADRHPDDHQQERHQEKGAAGADQSRREPDRARHRRRQGPAVLPLLRRHRDGRRRRGQG